MDTVADSLSGGEKARLLMGLATIDAPNLLILDEPTNHLDIEARESLVHALNDFPGAVILISHDRHMVEATMDRLWIVGDGTVKRYDGDLDDYKKLILSGARSGGGNQGEAIEEIAAPVVSKVDQRRLAAEKREALKPLKKKIITNLEVQMSRLQATIKTSTRSWPIPHSTRAIPPRPPISGARSLRPRRRWRNARRTGSNSPRARFRHGGLSAVEKPSRILETATGRR